MEVFLLLNDCEIQASVEEQERIVLQVASGEMDHALASGPCHRRLLKVGG